MPELSKKQQCLWKAAIAYLKHPTQDVTVIAAFNNVPEDRAHTIVELAVAIENGYRDVVNELLEDVY